MKKTRLFLALSVILLLAIAMSACSNGDRFEGFKLQINTLKERYDQNESVIIQIIETLGSPQGYNVYKKTDDSDFERWKKEISAEDSFTLDFPQFGTYTIKVVAVTDNMEQSANAVNVDFLVSDPIPVENILIKNNVIDLYYGDASANSFALNDLEIVYFPANATEKGLSYQGINDPSIEIDETKVIIAKNYIPGHEPYVIHISSDDNGEVVANLYVRINNSRPKYALTDFYVGYVDRINDEGIWSKRAYTYGDWVSFQCIEYAGMQKADSYEAAIKVGEGYVALGEDDFKIELEQGITFYKIKMPEQSGNIEYRFNAKIDGALSSVTKTVRVEVEAPPIQAVAMTLGDDAVTLLLDQTDYYVITHAIAPTNTADKSVTYEIAEGGEAFITIGNNGLVTPVAATTSPVIVTVRSKSNPEVSADIEISVLPLMIQEVITHSKPLTQPIQTAEDILFSLDTELEDVDSIKWYKDNALVGQTTEYTFEMLPPQTAGAYTVKAEVTLSGTPIIIKKTVTLQSCFDIVGLKKEYEVNAEVQLAYDTQLQNTQVIWAVHPVGEDLFHTGDTYTFIAAGDYRIVGTLSYNGDPVERQQSHIISIKDNVTHELYDIKVNGYYDGTNYAPLITWHKLKEGVSYTVEIKKGTQTLAYNSTDHSADFSADRFRVPHSDVTLNDNFDYRIKTDISDLYTGFRSYGSEKNKKINPEQYPYLEEIPGTSMNRYINSVYQLGKILNYIKVFRPTELGDDEEGYDIDLYFAIDYETDIEQSLYERTGNITQGSQTEEVLINAHKLITAANNAYGEGPGTSMVFSEHTGGDVTINLKPDEAVAIDQGSTYNGENDSRLYEPRYSDSLSDTDRVPGKEPILENDRTLAVSTSAQLYLAALWGYRPDPVVGSVAEEIYEAARAILNEIILPEMSDSEKALAIYDWLCINVAYDEEVYNSYMQRMAEATTKEQIDTINLDMSRKQSFHLEGAILNKIAVCDGISKAFTLLCAIEDLTVIRLSGAGNNNNGKGDVNHAWNAIMLEGAWYYVDATWGRLHSKVTGTQDIIIASNHYYFLAADEDMQSSHTFDGEAPVVASERSYYFFDYDNDDDDETIDLYFETEAEFDTFIDQIPSSGHVYEEFVIAYYDYSGTLKEHVETKRHGSNVIVKGDIVQYIIIRGTL